MIRTKHAFVFFTVLGVFLLGILVLIVIHKGRETDDATGIDDAVFVESETKLGVIVDSNEKDTSVRDSMLKKLSNWTSENIDEDFEENNDDDKEVVTLEEDVVDTEGSASEITTHSTPATQSTTTHVVGSSTTTPETHTVPSDFSGNSASSTASSTHSGDDVSATTSEM